MRSVLLALPLALLAGIAVAQDWGLIANISSTVGNHANRLCVGEGLRPTDIGCPTYAPSLTTAGDLIVSGTVSATRFVGDGSGLINLSASGDRIVSGTLSMLAISSTGYISLTTAGTNWGYFNSGLSYLPTLQAALVSSTNISVTRTGYSSQIITALAGGGGNYIISGTASVSTSSANGGTIQMATGSGLVMTVSGSNVGIGTAAPLYRFTVQSSIPKATTAAYSLGGFTTLDATSSGLGLFMRIGSNATASAQWTGIMSYDNACHSACKIDPVSRGIGVQN
ncbi:hypothetical protein NB311A_09796 [Nitrobacter sp. Nb-311A]|nr:hypothetical protein NB311A_09796 [Nitrobacter sp. Nb-311A]